MTPDQLRALRATVDNDREAGGDATPLRQLVELLIIHLESVTHWQLVDMAVQDGRGKYDREYQSLSDMVYRTAALVGEVVLGDPMLTDEALDEELAEIQRIHAEPWDEHGAQERAWRSLFRMAFKPAPTSRWRRAWNWVRKLVTR